MRIAQIEIENFRSIEKVKLQLPQVCALVGPNNAGKSNILEAARRVLALPYLRVFDFDQGDVFRRDPNRDIIIRCLLDQPIQYRKFKLAYPSEILGLEFKYTKYKQGPNKGQPRIEQNCLDMKNDRVLVPRAAPKKGVQTQYEPMTTIPVEIKNSVPLVYIGTNRSFKDHLPSARWSMLRQLFEDINQDLNDPTQVIHIKNADGEIEEVRRTDHFHKLMDEALDLLRTDKYNALESAIKKHALRQLGFDPDVDTDKLDFFFAPFDTMDFYKSLDIRVMEDGYAASAQEMGDGIQNTLVLAILKAFEETKKRGAILLIEEPEMFLHPQMQRSLYSTLRYIGKQNQVIYTTHSPNFVSIPDYEETVIVRKSPDGTVVQPSTLPMEIWRKEKLNKELDAERNELFFAHKVLLVEGPTEKLAIPVYASRLGCDLDILGATIVEVGGKRNLTAFADVATSFGIPTGIVYDRDSSDFANRRDEEVEYNDMLDGLAKPDGSVRVWQLNQNYEDNLSRQLTAEEYQKLCAKFAGYRKTIRARLIALEEDYPVPDPIPDVVSWLLD